MIVTYGRALAVDAASAIPIVCMGPPAIMVSGLLALDWLMAFVKWLTAARLTLLPLWASKKTLVLKPPQVFAVLTVALCCMAAAWAESDFQK